MGIKLQGGNNSTNLTSVNELNQLQVTTPLNGICGGFVALSSEVDAGGEFKSRTLLALDSSDGYRLRIGRDQTIFNSTFEGTAVQTHIWSQSASVMTSSVLDGFMALNAAKTIAATDVIYMRTFRQFPVYGTFPTYVDMWIRESNYDSTNTVSEWGLIYAATAGVRQLNDGICFRRTSGGQLRGSVVNNSIDIKEIAINTESVPARNGIGVFDPSQSNHYLITIMNDLIRFWINDTLVGEMTCPSAQAYFSCSSLPVGFRVLNLGITSIGRQLSVGYVNVGLGDQNVNKPWSHALCGLGGGAYQLQQGNNPGGTVNRTTGASGHPTTATARIAGTWTATSAPALNSLGGLWTSPAMSGLTTDADYPVFTFLNPAGTAALPGKTLYVSGVRIGETSVTVGATANPMFLSYIVMAESSASATTTADAATTTSGKSTVIGGQGFSATDTVGTMKAGFLMDFNSPLVVPPGKYLTVVVRPFGTVTGNTLVVSGSVAVNGYFE
jgi:hypothetical protein